MTAMALWRVLVVAAVAVATALVMAAEDPTLTPGAATGAAQRRDALVAAQAKYILLQHALTSQELPAQPFDQQHSNVPPTLSSTSNPSRNPPIKGSNGGGAAAATDGAKEGGDTGEDTGGSELPEKMHVDEAQTTAAFHEFIGATITYLFPAIKGDLEERLAALQATAGDAGVERLQRILTGAQNAVVARADTDKRLQQLATAVSKVTAVGWQRWPVHSSFANKLKHSEAGVTNSHPQTAAHDTDIIDTDSKDSHEQELQKFEELGKALTKALKHVSGSLLQKSDLIPPILEDRTRSTADESSTTNTVIHSMQSESIEEKTQRSIARQLRRRSWDQFSNINGAIGAILETLSGLLRLPFIPVVTHIAVLETISLKLAVPMPFSPTSGVRGVLRWVGKLKKDPTLQSYWQNKEASIVYSLLADIHKHGSSAAEAEAAHLQAAEALFACNESDKGLNQLADAFMAMNKAGVNVAKANSTYAQYKGRFPGQVRWPSAIQRPFVYVPFLHGQPFWDPSTMGKDAAQAEWARTARSLEANFEAIHAEFEQALASSMITEPMINGDDILIDRSSGGDKTHWQRLQFSRVGFWDSRACAIMPTVCNVLRADRGSMGKITSAKVRAINDEGGWAGPASLAGIMRSQGLNPESVRLPRVQLPEFSADGHVPLHEVSILRLAPGARLVPHCGSYNTRLVLHVGLQVPDKCGIRVGGEERRWEVGKALIFDDSFEHEVWNNDSTARYVLHADIWHPALSDLIEPPEVLLSVGSNRDDGRVELTDNQIEGLAEGLAGVARQANADPGKRSGDFDSARSAAAAAAAAAGPAAAGKAGGTTGTETNMNTRQRNGKLPKQAKGQVQRPQGAERPPASTDAHAAVVEKLARLEEEQKLTAQALTEMYKWMKKELDDMRTAPPGDAQA